jgi:hypothetical protein
MLLRTLSVFTLLAATLAAQKPLIGIIDFYGVQKVSVERLRKALGVKEGDPLPASKGEVEDRLNAVPGVVAAQMQAACCDGGKAILYVGIEERGAAHFPYRDEPKDDLLVPDAVATVYKAFLQQVNRAVEAGLTREDLTEGHSLLQYAPAREEQKKFVDLNDKYGRELRAVLKNARDPEERAIAAYVLGYARVKVRVLDDLFAALKDPDETVRANSVRALAAISVKAKLDPEAEIKVPATWFIEMLNSLSWTDRSYATSALVTLTDGREASMLEQLKERAWPTLLEMARWKHLEHALPAYILVGRIAGVPETELQTAWSEGKRDDILKQATAKKKK